MENISTTQNTYHFAGFRKRALSSVIDGIANGTGIGAIINIVMYYLHGNTLGLGTLFAILGIASPTAITVPFSKTKSGIHDMIVGTYAIKKQ